MWRTVKTRKKEMGVKGGKCVQGNNGILLWGQNASVKHPEESKQIIDKPWTMGSEKSARYTFELDLQCQRAAVLVWANKSVRVKGGRWKHRSRPGTLMNWSSNVKEAATIVETDESMYSTYLVSSMVMGSKSAYAYELVSKRRQR